MTTTSHTKYATGFEGKRWIFHGFVWGSIMFIILGIFVPLAEKEAITLKSAALDLALWLVAGLVYGLTAKGYFGWQAKKKAAREGQAGGTS